MNGGFHKTQMGEKYCLSILNCARLLVFRVCTLNIVAHVVV